MRSHWAGKARSGKDVPEVARKALEETESESDDEKDPR
jgi:hypothetical protein